MESEDDDAYFQNDDGGDDPVVPVQRVDTFLNIFRKSRQRISTPGPMAQSQKRESRAIAGRGAGAQQQQQQRPVTPLSSLLEYEDEDEGAIVVGTAPGAGGSDDEDGALRSPVLQHRQIQILPYDPASEPPVERFGAEDDGLGGVPSPSSSGGASSDPEDDLLEALVSKKPETRVQTQQPTPQTSPLPSHWQNAPGEKRKAGAPPPEILPRPREKRRRGGEEDEEEDMLERLTPKNRRVGAAGQGLAGAGVGAGVQGLEGAKTRAQVSAANAAAAAGKKGPSTGTLEGEDARRRFRLRLAAVSKVLGGEKPSVASKTDSKGGGNG